MIYSSDPDAPLGFTNDPAETVCWCAWLRLGHWTLYVWPFRAKIVRD